VILPRGGPVIDPYSGVLADESIPWWHTAAWLCTNPDALHILAISANQFKMGPNQGCTNHLMAIANNLH
jgi:hypothetical protein